MQCIYLQEKKCLATVRLSTNNNYYEPTSEDMSKYCKTNQFNFCPRLTSMKNYLEKSKH